MAAKTKKTAILTVRLEPSVKAALKAQAESEHRSLANMLEVAILKYCNEAREASRLTKKAKTSR